MENIRAYQIIYNIGEITEDFGFFPKIFSIITIAPKSSGSMGFKFFCQRIKLIRMSTNISQKPYI